MSSPNGRDGNSIDNGHEETDGTMSLNSDTEQDVERQVMDYEEQRLKTIQ